ncbi:hypothetical protein T484DRAFT_2369377 [Baffinella frigidus]|nr:hypothetical protein T484DRAFT_2369377 [Cryptophyta sp. CCMP2293]
MGCSLGRGFMSYWLLFIAYCLLLVEGEWGGRVAPARHGVLGAFRPSRLPLHRICRSLPVTVLTVVTVVTVLTLTALTACPPLPRLPRDRLAPSLGCRV